MDRMQSLIIDLMAVLSLQYNNLAPIGLEVYVLNLIGIEAGIKPTDLQKAVVERLGVNNPKMAVTDDGRVQAATDQYKDQPYYDSPDKAKAFVTNLIRESGMVEESTTEEDLTEIVDGAFASYEEPEPEIDLMGILSMMQGE